MPPPRADQRRWSLKARAFTLLGVVSLVFSLLTALITGTPFGARWVQMATFAVAALLVATIWRVLEVVARAPRSAARNLPRDRLSVLLVLLTVVAVAAVPAAAARLATGGAGAPPVSTVGPGEEEDQGPDGPTEELPGGKPSPDGAQSAAPGGDPTAGPGPGQPLPVQDPLPPVTTTTRGTASTSTTTTRTTTTTSTTSTTSTTIRRRAAHEPPVRAEAIKQLNVVPPRNLMELEDLRTGSGDADDLSADSERLNTHNGAVIAAVEAASRPQHATCANLPRERWKTAVSYAELRAAGTRALCAVGQSGNVVALWVRSFPDDPTSQGIVTLDGVTWHLP